MTERLEGRLTIGGSLLWTLAYFAVMVAYTAVDVLIWRKLPPMYSDWLNVITMALAIGIFFCFLRKKYGLRAGLFSKTRALDLLLTILCTAGLYLVTTRFLDPILERAFPMSEADYQAAVSSLRQSPLPAFLQVCLIAPMAEETLMRRFVLGELTPRYGAAVALILSSVLFALLHFNTVQTLSALICGTVLGLLYLKTNSLLCCMLAHAVYNTLSFAVII